MIFQSESRKGIRRAALITVMLVLFMFLLLAASIPASVMVKPASLPTVEVPEALLITNANVVDVRAGTILPGRHILVEQGKVSRISEDHPGGGVPEIDINGAFVAPGLVDMHVHVHDRKDLVTNLAYGVTAVRNLRGFPAHLRWRQELRDHDWLGATLFVSSPVLDGPKYAHALQQVVNNPDHARFLVNHYQQSGYDLLKVYGYLAPDVYEAVMDQASLIGMPVAKHGPYSPTEEPFKWLETVQSLEHVEDILQGPLNRQFDTDALRDYVEEIRKIRPYITPTLATFDHLTQLSTDKQAFVDRIPLQQLNPFFKWLYGMASVERWLQAGSEHAERNTQELDFLKHIARSLSDNGIPLLTGSDAGTMYMTAGISTHIEMQLMQDAGISDEKIIRYATLNAARAMQLDHEYGAVEPGRWADFIITAENPLDNIRNLQKPLSVVKRGQFIDRKSLDELLELADNPAGFYIGMGILLEDIVTRWWTDLVA